MTAHSLSAVLSVLLVLVLAFATAQAASAEIKTVYVVVPTHLDIGFTAPPDTVARGYKNSIDHAIELCERYPDYFYTVECAWQLREWMNRSSSEEVKKLGSLVKSGRVEIGGAFGTMHSGMMSGESINRMFDLGRELAKELGGDISTVIQDDVPGYAWAYPQAMRRHGIRFFLTGINTSFGGEPKLTVKDIPLYWEGPDGSRVLTWIAFGGYMDGNQWGIGIWEKEDDVFLKVPERAARIEKDGYPYDAFMVMASPGDNVDAAATEKIHRIINKWNATGKSPTLKMATPRQFFEHVEKEYAERFPTYRGDWSGQWEPAKLGAPRLIARIRFAQRILPAAESLWSVLALSGAARFPSEDIASAWDDLLTISEHTAGAGTGWPNLTTKEQAVWENWQHSFRGLSASYGASMLMEEGMRVLGSSVSADGPVVIVFNSLPWKRDGFVEVNMLAEAVKHGFAIKSEESGEEIECDLLDDGRRIRFLARDVPGVGYKLFRVSSGPVREPSGGTKESMIESSRLTVRIDEETGYVKSIHDKKLQREWVEDGRLFGGLYIAPQFDATLGGKGRLAEAGKLHAEAAIGKTYRTVRIRRSEGPMVESSVTLLDMPPVLKIECTLDTAKIPGDDEAVAILEFPFNLDAETLKIGVDGPNSFRRWPEDFLPGTARVGQVVQSYALLQDKNASVRFIPVEAPIISLGEIGLHGLRKTGAPRIYSYLLSRHFWGENKDAGRTRYDEVEPALGTKISFTYYLDFDAQAESGKARASSAAEGARRCALEATVPLFATFHSPWGPQKGKLGDGSSKSFFEVADAGVELSSAALASPDGEPLWRLRLQENSGQASGSLRATIGFRVHSAFVLDTATGQRSPLVLDGNSFQVPTSPFETITLLIRPVVEAK